MPSDGCWQLPLGHGLELCIVEDPNGCAGETLVWGGEEGAALKPVSHPRGVAAEGPFSQNPLGPKAGGDAAGGTYAAASSGVGRWEKNGMAPHRGSAFAGATAAARGETTEGSSTLAAVSWGMGIGETIPGVSHAYAELAADTTEREPAAAAVGASRKEPFGAVT